EGYQFDILFNSDEIGFHGHESELENIFTSNIAAGPTRFLFSFTDGQPVRIPDGAPVITIEFLVLQDGTSLTADLSNVIAFSSLFIEALPISLCGVPVLPSSGNSTVDFCIPLDQPSVEEGGTYLANLSATGFNSLSSFSFQIAFSTELYEFVSISSPLIGPTQAAFIEPGILEINWSTDVPEGLTITDGSTIMQIEFTALAAHPTPHVDVSDQPGSMSAIFVNGQAATTTACGFEVISSGGVTDICPTLPGSITNGQTVNIPVTVQNFANIGYLQIPIAFDSAQLEIDQVLIGSLPESVGLSWQISPTSLEVFVLDFSDEGFALSNGDILFVIQGTALADVPTLDLAIDPMVGSFLASRSFNNLIPIPIRACGNYYVGGQLANVNAGIARDANNNCSGEAIGDFLNGWEINFMGVDNQLAISTVSAFDGRAYLALPTGTYTYEWIPPGGDEIWEFCPSGSITITDPDESITLDATANALVDCSQTRVVLSSGNLRPCFDNNVFIIVYDNTGTSIAEDAYVTVSFDETFTPLDANLPFIDQGNDQYRFELGDLAINQTGSIIITGIVDCDLPVGSTICAEATIFPNKECETPNPSFQGGELVVDSECDGETARFTITNIGDGPTGPVGLVVIEDVVIYMETTIDLATGESTEIPLPAAGTTYRLETDLPLAAPYLSQGLDIREGCGTLPGGGISLGFANDLSLLDDDPYFDRYCQETSAAYDPNDKQAIPNGVGPDHLTAPNGSFDYKIRFQNTGTDTAFTVVIIDTLDAQVLDLSTLQTGISSHPYRMSLRNNVLEFAF
ncbi:MAG: hypothetical protein AAFU67_09865, partial [Bacteroidota bacterium]